MGKLEWLLLLVLSMLWGSSFFFAEIALSALPPFTIVFGRTSIAALVLNVVVRVKGDRLPSSRKIWAAFLLMGLLNNLVPFSLIFWGQTQISSSLAAILNATTPVWTVLLAHVLTTDERLSVGRLGGALLGLVGVAVMVGLDALQGLGTNAIAQLSVVGAAISYACAGIYGRRFKGIPPLVVAAGQVTGTSVMMVPVLLFADGPWKSAPPTIEVWGALLSLALFGTALAYIIYFYLLSAIGATNLLLVAFLIPASAVMLGVFILGERLDARHFVGIGSIGLGLITIDGRMLRVIARAARS